jgi:crossover junction endodeoxyribonuclease RuvC
MNFCGIDPSLTGTGIAVVSGRKLLYSDRIEPPDQMRGVQRLAYLRQCVNDRLARVLVSAVCVEGYSFSSKQTRAHATGEWGGVLRLTLADHALPTFEFAPSSLKLYATGKGNAKGKEPMAEALDLYFGGCMGLSHDEVDAVWLALAVQDRMSKARRLPAFRMKALQKMVRVHTP